MTDNNSNMDNNTSNNMDNNGNNNLGVRQTKPTLKRFSDFASQDDLSFNGDKVSINDIVNQEIIIENFEIRSSKFENKGDYAIVQIKVGNDDRVFFTGSKILIEQLEKYKKELPYIAKIKRFKNKYYKFS